MTVLFQSTLTIVLFIFSLHLFYKSRSGLLDQFFTDKHETRVIKSWRYCTTANRLWLRPLSDFVIDNLITSSAMKAMSL